MNRKVAVVGASSPVGQRVVRLAQERGHDVIAFTRKDVAQSTDNTSVWRQLPDPNAPVDQLKIKDEEIYAWIFIAHIWVVPDYFALIAASGAHRLLALSSTSKFTKVESAVDSERVLSSRLQFGETQIANWSATTGIQWTVLRPTLIYGGGGDRNVSAIASFAKRFKIFPLIGNAGGLRQPVHVDDVAIACLDAVDANQTANKAYNISGAEVLSYRDMVKRIFLHLGQTPLLIKVPLSFFKIAIGAARMLPRFRHWSSGMAERMNKDMVFDHQEAARDFGFAPRKFVLTAEDV